MLFGLKSEFAIEAMIEPGLARPSAVYGRMQVWCAGTSIGDFSNPYCSLYPAYLGFKQLLTTIPNLWLDEFEGLTDEHLTDLLDRLLYAARGDQLIEDERTVKQCEGDWEKYRSFNFLTNWGEQFDREGKAFVFYPPGQPMKVLIRSGETRHILSLRASASIVIEAIRLFLQWFEVSATSLLEQDSS
nr:hypothetical protein HUO10_004637 [Paraburkholderia busanensis]